MHVPVTDSQQRSHIEVDATHMKYRENITWPARAFQIRIHN